MAFQVLLPGGSWQAFAIKGAKALMVAAVAEILVLLADLYISRKMRPLVARARSAQELARRRKVLLNPLRRGARLLFFGAGLLYILYIFGVPMLPVGVALICAALILGVALRDALADIVAGIALAASDCLSLGERVAIGGVSGVVKDANSRFVVIEDEQGRLHYFANRVVATLRKEGKGQ